MAHNRLSLHLHLYFVRAESCLNLSKNLDSGVQMIPNRCSMIPVEYKIQI